MFKPFLTIDEKSFYTKHYYAGDQRIASRPAGKAAFGALSDSPEIIELRMKQRRDAQIVADTVDLGLLKFEEKPSPDPQPLLEVYYFHPDHLGSSTMISDGAGYAYQMFLDLPFGETLAEQRRNGRLDNPYKFNGKELDAETGLYYYGARYYDPRISNWLSVDPLAEQTMTPYQYTYQNPINLTDPTRMAPDSGDGWGRKGNVVEYSENITQDNYQSLGYDEYCDACDFNYTPEGYSYHLGIDGSVSSTFTYGSSFNNVETVFSIYDTRYDITTPLGSTIKGKGNGIFPSDPGSIIDASKARRQFYQWNDPGARIAMGVLQGAAAELTGYGIGKIGTIKNLFGSSSTTLYRSVSPAELSDIGMNGLRMGRNGYATGKLFTTTASDASFFSKSFYQWDQTANTIIRVKVPKNVMRNSGSFIMDGKNVISIPANQLKQIQNITPLNYSPIP